MGGPASTGASEVVVSRLYGGTVAEKSMAANMDRFNMKVVVRIMVGKHIKERVVNVDSNATLRDLSNVALERTRDTVGPSELLPPFKLALPPSTLVKDAG